MWPCVGLLLGAGQVYRAEFLSVRAEEGLICSRISWLSCWCEAEGAVKEVAFTVAAPGYLGGAPLAAVAWMNLWVR